MKRLRSLLLVFGVVLVAMPAVAQPDTRSAAATEPGTIRVVTTATTVVKPDIAELDVGISTEKPTAAAATSENARKMEQIVAALKKEAGAGAEVKTIGFYVNPSYGRPRPDSNQQTVVGYTVINTVRVRTGDVKAVGRTLDAAFKAGANNVQRMAFMLKDPEPAQTEALRQATAKARGRATAMAAALNLKVGAVLSITEGYRDQIPMYDGNESGDVARMRTTSTPVEAGTLEVSATVTVVFALARS